MNTSRKSLLLIMPSFFNYPKLICDELEKMGYDVDFVDDRPSTNAWVKAIIRINKDYISRYISKYFVRVMDKIKRKKYDVVFLISGQSLSFSEPMLREIRKNQKQARFLLYQWDSQENFPYIKQMHKIFDKCYSFDKNDVATTSCLSFLPLFYSREYEKIGNRRCQDYKYDLCFIGTAHPKKYSFVKEISSALEDKYPRRFIYFYFPSIIVYIYRKLKNIEFRHAHLKEFRFVPLGEKEIRSIFQRSICILDSAQAGQVGLTMRVFEALGAKKKIITTNDDIVNYDFFKPENIYVYTGNVDLNNVFFKSDYVPIDNSIYKKYSLRKWLETILA